MLKCFLMRKKIYEYLDNSLSDVDTIRVKKHLETCGECREKFERMKSIIALAAEKKAPVPDNEFWHKFQVDLDSKLNEKLVLPAAVKRRPAFRYRPAVAYVSTLLFVFVLGISLYRKPSVTFRIDQDEDLVNGVVELYDLDENQALNHNDESDMEEILLLDQLSQL